MKVRSYKGHTVITKRAVTSNEYCWEVQNENGDLIMASEEWYKKDAGAFAAARLALGRRLGENVAGGARPNTGGARPNSGPKKKDLANKKIPFQFSLQSTYAELVMEAAEKQGITPAELIADIVTKEMVERFYRGA